jgi:hypothetical protein
MRKGFERASAALNLLVAAKNAGTDAVPNTPL